MNLTKNGVTLIVDDAEVFRLALAQLTADEPQEMQRGVAIPRIGEAWIGQGGVYAGLARGRDGAPDYHLIVGPEHEGTDTWDALDAWAKATTTEGHNDFALPTRKEQALCFANVPELFQSSAYWSGETHASDSSYAWSQYFVYGNQGSWGKTSELRARAVRRLAIQ